MQPAPSWMEYPAVNNERAHCVICKDGGTGMRVFLSAEPCGKYLRLNAGVHSATITAAAFSLQVHVVYLGVPGTQPHAVPENEVCGSKFEPKQL